MTRRAFRACTRKEILLLRRDPHTLLLLFVMPAVFILVMSLALQDRFEGGGATVASVLVSDADGSDSARTVIDRLQANEAFEVIETGAVSAEALGQRVLSDGHDFGLRIDAGFGTAVTTEDAAAGDALRVIVAPEIERQRERLLLAAVGEGLGRARVAALARRLSPLVDIDLDEPMRGPRVVNLYGGDRAAAPSSVQQSVPAWLVFGVFFVVIPLSNTMIRERQLGTDRRLRTTPAGEGDILLGKLLPYFVVNQVQVVAMLLVGALLVPALGGDRLELAGVPPATLAVMAVALSLAALGYAMLVAVVSSTTEQATMLGGGGNIILAAIGGIMVPEFVMPPALQAATQVSPMAWGLDGFLIGFLHAGGVRDVAPHAGALAAFGATGVGVAWWLQRRRVE